MSANPDHLPLSPETFRGVHKLAGQIAILGEDLTIEGEYEWIVHADFPKDLTEDTVIGKVCNRTVNYTRAYYLSVVSRMYGEHIWSRTGDVPPLGHIFFLLGSARGYGPLVGLDYTLLLNQQVSRLPGLYWDINTTLQELVADKLLADLNLEKDDLFDHAEAGMPVEIGENEGQGLIHLMQRALEEGHTESLD